MSKILDDTTTWSDEQGTLYHHLMHLPEQVWKAGYEPDVKGHLPEAAGVLLVGRGVGMTAAQLAMAFLPVRAAVQTAVEPPQALPGDWLTVQLLEPGQAHGENVKAFVAPRGTLLPEGAPCALYDETLARPACLGAMFFSLAALLEHAGLLQGAQELARPVVGMLMQKAGAVAVGLETELNMAKGMALRMQGRTPVFVPLLPALEPAACWARAQANRLAGQPAAHLGCGDAWDADVLAAWCTPPWQPVLLSHMDANGMPARHNGLPELLKDAPVLYAEGKTQLERFFSLVYPLAMVAFYSYILQTEKKL